jgi:hypothetical protein
MKRLLGSCRDGRLPLALRGQRRSAPSPRIMRVQLRTFLTVVVVLMLGVPASALANANDVIRDCAQDGKLDKHYSQKELAQAEKNLPSDIDEYTDCRQAIRSAMGGGTGNTGGSPPNGIVTPSGAVAGSPQDVQALDDLATQASKGKRATVVIAGKRLLPGNAGETGVLSGLAGSNGMPTALMLAIGSLIALAVVIAYLAAREKIPLVRRVALRIFNR